MVVALLFGGQSSEYDISRKSMMNFINNIDDKHEIVKIGITRNGDYKLHLGNPSEIENDTWENNSRDIIFSNSKQKKGIYILYNQDVSFISIDVVIPVLHGENGEDGTVQGLLNVSGIPYVGSNVLASSIGFDKYMTKMLVKNLGIRQAKGELVVKGQYNLDDTIKQIEHLSLPVFVKPCRAGSSIGVNKVEDYNELEYVLRKAFEYDKRVLIEEAIVGRELECAVLGNDIIEVSGVGEIKSEHSFYDFHSKYESTVSQTLLELDLDKRIVQTIREASGRIYKLLNCKGLSRVDFFLESSTGEVVFNEINTFPGFTSISMYPKLFEKEGYTMTELIEKLIQLALEKP